MSNWLHRLALNAIVRTGLSADIVVWGAIAAIATILALAFLLIAVFVWLADRYDAVTSAAVLGCAFVAIAAIAIFACLRSRRRNMERARLELAARNGAVDWLDPTLMAMGLQVGQVIGWRKLVSLAAVGLLAAGLAREWLGREETATEEPPRSSVG